MPVEDEDTQQLDVHPLFSRQITRQVVPPMMKATATEHDQQEIANVMTNDASIEESPTAARDMPSVPPVNVEVSIKPRAAFTAEQTGVLAPNGDTIMSTGLPSGTFLAEMHADTAAEKELVVRMEVNASESTFPNLSKFDQGKPMPSDSSECYSEAETVRPRANSSVSAASSTTTGLTKTSMAAMAAVNGINPMNLDILKKVASGSAVVSEKQRLIVL
eukprot:CAMPEP_0184297768 /NCGR_PEP_ID=MMETSP1049-20130417/8654_1 /TAXON_ID=77928 /ORGANISM="Proteomonas sulcata, Strain CCMP704" /LENGTH=217 /DNA_ID=CAMNT_0026607647 /DNA_START=38 /DNA_END=691 /DNA_ORIENTATION=-